VILNLAFLMVILASVAGIIYIILRHDYLFITCKVFAVAAVVVQFAWLVQAAIKIPYCALLDPWGVMAIITILGIASSWWAGKRYRSTRLFIGVILLLATATGLGKVFLPAPGSSNVTMGWILAFHILMLVLGYSVLAVGCVSGLMIILRSKALKSTNWAAELEVPWPSLTTMDHLFVRSIGIGIVLLSAGIFLGVASAPGAELEGPWYVDLKVVLSLLSFSLYGIVLYLRKRQGFTTNTVVGLSTLGFLFIFIGMIASRLFDKGFHQF